MGRRTPGTAFTQGPATVQDGVEEAALPLDALGHDERAQAIGPLAEGFAPVIPAPRMDEAQVVGSQSGEKGFFYVLFGALNRPLEDVCDVWDLPRSPFFSGRVGVEWGGLLERFADLL